MCSYGGNEVSTETGERVGRMVNGTSLALGLLQGWELTGRTMGAETSVNNELTEVGRFLESTRGRFGEEILG